MSDEISPDPIRDKKNRAMLFSILLTFFLDNMGWSIVLPILAPLLLGADNGLLHMSASEDTKTILFGFLLASYSFAQLFGAPILGELADRRGRRLALLLTTVGSILGNLISAWSIQNPNLSLLFLGRLLTGFCAGNLSICLAAVADLSPTEKIKSHNFGRVSLYGGLSSIIGAFLGGQLSDSSISPYFNFALPLWVTAGLGVGNLIYLHFKFKETLQPFLGEKLELFKGQENLRKAFQNQPLRIFFQSVFVFFIALVILIQFNSVFLLERFHFSSAEIGYSYAYMGLTWSVGAGLLNRLLIKWWNSRQIFRISMLCFSLALFSAAFVFEVSLFLILLGLILISGSIAWTNGSVMLSHAVGPDIQGKVMGISQSLNSFASIIGPILAGLIIHIDLALAYVLAGFLAIVGWVLLFFKKNL